MLKLSTGCIIEILPILHQYILLLRHRTNKYIKGYSLLGTPFFDGNMHK